jgi:uncharacterized protein YbbK (DUF523 family)
MRKVAISACLLGEACRYDGRDNRNKSLLQKLEGCELIPFCPEDFAFGTPRPTMDLIETESGVRAVSNGTGEDLSNPVIAYAESFFNAYPDIDLFIGKDRSPSCGVSTAKCYSREKVLLSTTSTGLMAAEAKRRAIPAIDAETYIKGEYPCE